MENNKEKQWKEFLNTLEEVRRCAKLRAEFKKGKITKTECERRIKEEKIC